MAAYRRLNAAASTDHGAEQRPFAVAREAGSFDVTAGILFVLVVAGHFVELTVFFVQAHPRRVRECLFSPALRSVYRRRRFSRAPLTRVNCKMSGEDYFVAGIAARRVSVEHADAVKELD